jgi:hypothetical protein
VPYCHHSDWEVRRPSSAPHKNMSQLKPEKQSKGRKSIVVASISKACKLPSHLAESGSRPTFICYCILEAIKCANPPSKETRQLPSQDTASESSCQWERALQPNPYCSRWDSSPRIQNSTHRVPGYYVTASCSFIRRVRVRHEKRLLASSRLSACIISATTWLISTKSDTGNSCEYMSRKFKFD